MLCAIIITKQPEILDPRDTIVQVPYADHGLNKIPDIVTVVALYDEAQTLPLPDMYGKNLTFKTGGVDGCDCAEIFALIDAGKIYTTHLITHLFQSENMVEDHIIFENKLDGVIKIAITTECAPLF